MLATCPSRRLPCALIRHIPCALTHNQCDSHRAAVVGRPRMQRQAAFCLSNCKRTFADCEHLTASGRQSPVSSRSPSSVRARVWQLAVDWSAPATWSASVAWSAPASRSTISSVVVSVYRNAGQRIPANSAIFARRRFPRVQSMVRMTLRCRDCNAANR